MYSSASSLACPIDNLQSAIYIVKISLFKWKLVQNAEKTKMMCFSRYGRIDDGVNKIVTLNGKNIERIATYKYLGFLLEELLL